MTTGVGLGRQSLVIEARDMSRMPGSTGIIAQTRGASRGMNTGGRAFASEKNHKILPASFRVRG